jgi:hypothetical protein
MVTTNKDDNLDLRKETSQKSRYSQGGITERPSAKEIGRGWFVFGARSTKLAARTEANCN